MTYDRAAIMRDAHKRVPRRQAPRARLDVFAMPGHGVGGGEGSTGGHCRRNCGVSYEG
jgi:hypothetical protein